MPVVNYTTINGQIVCENRGGVKTLFMPDTLGNVIETRNMDTGAQTSSTTYWPYGEVRTQTGTNPSPFGFCGVWGYYTQAGQPTYVRARYYRPNLGRWQTVDPLWPWEAAYSYGTTPTIGVDAFGLMFGLMDGFLKGPGRMLPQLGGPITPNPNIPGQVGGVAGGVRGAAMAMAMERNGSLGTAKAGYIGGNLFVRCLLEPQLNCPKNARAEADNEIFDIAKDRFIRVDGNTPGNAVTHCTSACWATVQCGRAAAERFANDVYEDWTFWGNAFDRINNIRGFNCGDSVSAGRATPAVIDCYNCCVQNIVYGRQSWH